MANKHLIDGLESSIPRHNPTVIYKDKRCRICDSNEFIVFNGIYVCCKRCGVIAACSSFQPDDINKAKPIGFNKIHKKRTNAKKEKKMKLKKMIKCQNRKEKINLKTLESYMQK